MRGVVSAIGLALLACAPEEAPESVDVGDPAEELPLAQKYFLF